MYYITKADGSRIAADGSGSLANVEELIANKTLTVEDSGKTFKVGTDALVITLPPTVEGATYTIVNSGVDGNNIITVSPEAADAIYGTVANAADDSVASGVDGKDIINTKATANKGDYIVLVGNGAGGWDIQGGVGIWASES